MLLHLNSERAEESDRYVVRVAPAGDVTFVTSERAKSTPGWLQPDGITPTPFEVVFNHAEAEVEDTLGKYMVERGIASKGKLVRKVKRFFTQDGRPVEVAIVNGELRVKKSAS